jgi:CRISPR-associated protein Csm2
MPITLYEKNADGTKKVKPELFSHEAETLAKNLKKDHDDSNGKKNKRTQLRKFYDEILRLQVEASTDQRNWYDVLPQVHMLAAKTAYADGRELVSPRFNSFITDCIKQVDDAESLKIFANFFEAMMGFYRLHGPKN